MKNKAIVSTLLLSFFQSYSLTSFASATAQTVQRPQLRVNPSTVTISGISSGAFMAMQMQVAYSKEIAGSVSLAGGSYYCSLGNAARAGMMCMQNPSAADSTAAKAYVTLGAAAGSVDDLEALNGRKIILFHGEEDHVVKPEAMAKSVELLSQIAPNADVQSYALPKMGHGWPTIDQGLDCGVEKSPWMNACDYDFAGDLLTKLYGKLKRKGVFKESNLVRFVEEKNLGDGLHSSTYAYIPKQCDSGSCHLHVALHGCGMSVDDIGETFVRQSGLAEWAETNNMVILLPQIAKTPVNLNTCWDWFGYTSPRFATQYGPQMNTLIHRIREMTGVSGSR